MYKEYVAFALSLASAMREITAYENVGSEGAVQRGLLLQDARDLASPILYFERLSDCSVQRVPSNVDNVGVRWRA